MLIAGDVREQPRTSIPESFAALLEVTSDGLNVHRCVFVNPIDSERIAILRRLHVYCAEDFFAGGAGIVVSLVYNLQPQTGFVLNPITGKRLVSGYHATLLGATPQIPRDVGDHTFPPKNSRMGWHTPPINNIDGGYIWRGLIGGAAGPEVLENFELTHGPRIIIYPGGNFVTYAIDNTFHGYMNMWWDEYPIT